MWCSSRNCILLFPIRLHPGWCTPSRSTSIFSSGADAIMIHLLRYTPGKTCSLEAINNSESSLMTSIPPELTSRQPGHFSLSSFIFASSGAKHSNISSGFRPWKIKLILRKLHSLEFLFKMLWIFPISGLFSFGETPKTLEGGRITLDSFHAGKKVKFQATCGTHRKNRGFPEAQLTLWHLTRSSDEELC